MFLKDATEYWKDKTSDDILVPFTVIHDVKCLLGMCGRMAKVLGDWQEAVQLSDLDELFPDELRETKKVLKELT